MFLAGKFIYMILACLSVLVVFGIASFLAQWIWGKLISDIISTLQGLVDKLKEYDLDARAGVLICRGHDLHIHYIDPILQKLLGSVEFVNDILPESSRESHRIMVSRHVGLQQLPKSLDHPLRNVKVLNKDKIVVQAKLIIGKIGILSNMYYVIVQVVTDHEKSRFQVLRRNSSSFCNQAFHQSQLSEQTQTRRTTQDSEGAGESHHSHFPEDHEKMASESDGLSAISPIEHNFVPATERYAHATVLYMDIVGFTHQCAARPLDEISGWMTRVHSAIDELLARHAVHKVETRGDCVVCVSGTSLAQDGGGAPRDLCGDQATRMLAFGRDLGRALAAIEGTWGRRRASAWRRGP